MVWAMTLQVLEKGVGYIVLAVLTRTMLKAELGAMFFAISISELMALALNFGTDTYLIRRVASDPEHGLTHLSNVLSIRVVNTAGGYIILNLAIWLIQPELSPIMLLVSAYDFLEEIYFSFAAFFSARRQIIYRLLIFGGFKLMSFPVILLVAYVTRALLPVLWTYLTFNLLLVVTVFIFTRRVFGRIRFAWRPRAILETLRSAFPFFLVNGLGLMHMRLDTIMVGAMLDFQQLANYGLGIRLLEVTRFIIRPLMTVFLPIFVEYSINRRWQKFRQRFNQFMIAAFAIGTLLAIVMQVFGLEVIRSLFGPNYVESVAPAQILFISLPFLYLYLIANVAANALHMERKTVIVLLVAVVTNLGLNWFAIPAFGITGAAWVTVISQTILAIGMLALVLPKLRHPPRVSSSSESIPEQVTIEDAA